MLHGVGLAIGGSPFLEQVIGRGHKALAEPDSGSFCSSVGRIRADKL
jgi:hypothetical protein